MQQTKEMEWPRQPYPTERAWARWKKALKHIAPGGKLKKPLGGWKREETEAWRFWRVKGMEAYLYHRTDEGWERHEKVNGEYWKHYSEKGEPALPPVDPTPTQVTRDAEYYTVEGEQWG